MWMMGCGDGGGFNVADSFNGRRLRPLIPKPSSSTTTTTTTTTVTSTSTNSTTNVGATAAQPCFSRIHGSDHFVLNHHLATAVCEQSKRDFGAPTVVSSRWNPTPEQLRNLEELYRRGTRTPTAEQIQQITAQLRRFGKIEGKNVFYWFQNHKARERQKRRRRLECEERDTGNLDNKESGSSRTDFEVEQEAKSSWALPTNCTSTFSKCSQETVSMRRAERAAVSESKLTHGWIQFQEGELHQRRKCSSPPTTHHLINTSTSSYPSTTTATKRILNSKFINSQNLNVLTPPTQEYYCHPLNHFPITGDRRNVGEDDHDHQCGESHTLQLFPLPSAHHEEINCSTDNVKENEVQISVMDANSTNPHQFFEFL